MNERLLAGIEAGGTKFLCAIADSGGKILAHARIPSTSPVETLGDVARFFSNREKLGEIAAAGIASFGPLDLDRASPGFGRLTTTPKSGWAGLDMAGEIGRLLAVPATIDTDVNCAGLAEGLYGGAIGLARFCYITVGTGIGVGLIEDGRSVTLGAHSEAGHIRIARAKGDYTFNGICPYHGDCAEGLASGPAMKARWLKSPEDLEIDHAAWEIEAHYIAAICANLTYIVRPQRIVIGGGVLERSTLYNRIRVHFEELVNGYALDRWSCDAETYIARPMLRDPSPGLVGALEHARRAAERQAELAHVA